MNLDARCSEASEQLGVALAGGSQSIGVRGRASYRGSDGYRNDYGLFVNRAFIL